MNARILLVLCFASLVTVVTPVNAATYKNPVIGDMKDPYCLRDNNQDGNGDRWMVYRQKLNSVTNWDRVACIDRCFITTEGNVNITATRNTWETAPVPLP